MVELGRVKVCCGGCITAYTALLPINANPQAQQRNMHRGMRMAAFCEDIQGEMYQYFIIYSRTPYKFHVARSLETETKRSIRDNS
jgi:hypothetical protein